jgi:uncharacterized membrane protein
MKTIETKEMVLTALAMALVYTATLLIQIPNGLDGYLNLGDGFILVFAGFLNPALSFLAAGIGSALADLTAGYAYYFIPTLLIKGFEGFFVSWLIHKYGEKLRLPAYIIGTVIMVIGYFFAKWYLKGSAAVAVLSISGNTIQGIAGLILAYAAYPLIKSLFVKRVQA